MAMNGTIKEIKKVDGQIIAAVLVGDRQEVEVVIGQPPGDDGYPMEGDHVTFDRSGAEYVAFAVDSVDAETATGEKRIFSRDTTGAIVAYIHLDAAGKVSISPGTGKTCKVGTGGDFVALAQRVEAKIDAIVTAIGTSAVQAGDGGALLASNIVAALNISLPLIGDVKSSNLKADY